ncbi:MAG: insulinase family protein [candidate division Zixibacteria bacterium]|nr:insulinase family protein [candidate division Zixibacteria bacterium]
MFKKRCLALSLVLVSFLFSFSFGQKGSGAAGKGKPLDSFKGMEKDITEYTLPNGLKFIILERHEAPVVSFCTYANVGSNNEVTGITGISHIFEHMAFKGTTDISTKDYEKEKIVMAKEDSLFNEILMERDKGDRADQDRLKKLQDEFSKTQDEAGKYVVSNQFGAIVEEAGGVGLNAFTSDDQTCYIYSFPSNKLELWMALESDRFIHPVLREFYKEKDVIMEERRLGIESSPFGKLFEEFMAAAFKSHPYHHQVIGHMSDLQSITRHQAQDYYKKYYIPNNLTIGIVGDVNPKEVIAFAQEYFGSIPRGEYPSPVRTVEPPQLGEKRIEVEDKSQPILLIGYHRPNTNNSEDPAFSAIADYLGGGRTSRLYKILVKEKKIAVQVGSIPAFPAEKYPTLIAFYAVPSKDHSNQECEDIIYQEIEKIKTDPISTEDLNAIKTRAKANFIRQLKSNMGMGIQLTSYQVISGDWRNLFKELDRINSLTPSDIQKAANEYLKKTNRTVGEIVTSK